MKFTRLSVFALFCLTLVGINAAQSGKDYWKAIWPNTPMPQALLDLLQPESRTNVPIRGEEVKQYLTMFFQHDLYPGNKISLGIHKNYDTQPKHLRAPTRGEKKSEDISQPFGAWKSSKKTNEEISQPFEAWKSSEKINEEISQPFGAWKSSEKTNEEISQPFGGAWKSSEKTNEEISQPFGAWKLSEKTNEEISQPFGAWKSSEKTIEEISQPFGGAWKSSEKTNEEISQPFGAWKSSKKPSDEISQPFGAWKSSEKTNDEISQPFGAWKSSEKTNEEISQPFGAWKSSEKTNEEISQPFGAWKSSEKTKDEINQPFGAWKSSEKTRTRKQGEKTSEEISLPFGAPTWDKKDRQTFDSYCGHPSAKGEDKYCALSLKSMIRFAISKLGTNIKVITSSFAQTQDQYRVDEVKKIGDNAVMCHRFNFKNIVFYCHKVNATTVYMVPLVASDGTKAKALTICHQDTRGMNPDHLYKVLKVKPGTAHVCHFVGKKAIAWVPNNVVDESVDHPYAI